MSTPGLLAFTLGQALSEDAGRGTPIIESIQTPIAQTSRRGLYGFAAALRRRDSGEARDDTPMSWTSFVGPRGSVEVPLSQPVRKTHHRHLLNVNYHATLNSWNLLLLAAIP
jgi:hypothetical protein